jgi:hypothetical protein
MADTTLGVIQSVLYEMRGPMQSLYPTRNFLLAYLSGLGQDGAPGRITPLQNPTQFSGSSVRVPLDTVQMQGGGWVGEGGTVNVPIAPVITQATITLKKFIQPFGISLEAMEDSKGANSAIDALALNLQKARIAMADAVNTAICGDGTAALAPILSGTSPGLTMVLGNGSAGVGVDWDKLYVGQVVDVLTTATGADAGQGKRRRIASINIGTGTITFDTAQQASDGGSGNITFTGASSSLYVTGSYSGAATKVALQGGFEAAGRGTSFEGVNLTTYPQFAAVDGRAGDVTVKAIDDAMIDLGVTLAQRAGDGLFDAAYGDPNAINVYKNTKVNQTRFNVPTGVVATRFTGIQVDLGNQIITIVPERKSKPGSIKFFNRQAATLYGSTAGPDYDDLAGSMFKQFNRVTNYEVWLKDRLELGWHAPSKMVYFDNLQVQSTAG